MKLFCNWNNWNDWNDGSGLATIGGLVLMVFVMMSSVGCVKKEIIIEREAYDGKMEGVWVATVKNIDWPSSFDITELKQKSEMRAIVERCAEIGIRDIVFQVKPAQEVFYASEILPYSQYLAGQYTNDYAYDPLAYVLELTKKHGLRLHAWINPFRVMDRGAFVEYARGGDEAWLVEYGEYHWLNPTIEGAREFVIECVMEIVENYDIDGIHIDDYFYPYPIRGVEFADEEQYERGKKRGQSKDDFRRQSIDSLIYGMSSRIKERKPHVVFGISPFPVWRNAKDDERGSDTSAFVSSYGTLYADTLKWFDEGVVDYMAPQLYFDNSNKYVPFDVIFGWWEERAKQAGTPLYIGLPAYQILEKYSKTYTLEDYKYFYNLVSSNENVAGVIHYSVQYLLDDSIGLGEFLRERISDLREEN